MWEGKLINGTFRTRVCWCNTWTKLRVRLVLDNQYTYQGYWDYQNKKIGLDVCKAQLEQEKKKVAKALQQKHSVDILLVLFNRLYTLRNQLMHGGSTYKSSLNRKQLQDGCQILSALLPAFLYIALENADSLDLGKPFYPVAQVSWHSKWSAQTKRQFTE